MINSKLRIHSKPDRNKSKLTVCSSTTSNEQIMARDVNVAIESIDVVTYCTPKDILITDQSKNTYQEP